MLNLEVPGSDWGVWCGEVLLYLDDGALIRYCGFLTFLYFIEWGVFDRGCCGDCDGNCAKLGWDTLDQVPCDGVCCCFSSVCVCCGVLWLILLLFWFDESAKLSRGVWFSVFCS